MKRRIVSFTVSIVGLIILMSVMLKNFWVKYKQQKEDLDKHRELFVMMNQWVKAKQENQSIVEYLQNKGYKEIAIYGMSCVGETLLNELNKASINVKYGIDKNADNIYLNIGVVSLDDEFSDVDAVIVTAITYFNEIREMLSKRMNCPILSLKDILNEIIV